MTLKTYKSKRNFSETSEPLPKKGKPSPGLKFCVQKHDASHLHYDFRLELDGVLLSWAIPKGPSMNPKDKRLAVHVEDHPVDYLTFEGTIPAGNYGAGTVKLWDLGTYLAQGAETKKESETILRKELKAGHLKIELDGEKLKGKFALIRMKGDDNDKNWLLIKEKDEYATTDNILKSDWSVNDPKNKKKALKAVR